MHRTLAMRRALCGVLALIATHAFGQNALEIIPLRHSTAEQVLPALRPLIEPGATLTGQGTQLIVRTSPGNLEELSTLLKDKIETEVPSTFVSVSQPIEDLTNQLIAGSRADVSTEPPLLRSAQAPPRGALSPHRAKRAVARPARAATRVHPPKEGASRAPSSSHAPDRRPALYSLVPCPTK